MENYALFLISKIGGAIMLSRREHQMWALTNPEKREYRSDEERRFFETIENPPPPTEELREIVREFRQFATRKD
jgi:hypothetical protein